VLLGGERRRREGASWRKEERRGEGGREGASWGGELAGGGRELAGKAEGELAEGENRCMRGGRKGGEN
jgi:hypothetical protein